MDSSEVGRFGTLHLMKRLDPTAVAASYPVDEEEVTIGRDPSCSIRLYYESVSMLHCKIIFREQKVRAVQAQSKSFVSQHIFVCFIGLRSGAGHQWSAR